jgi:hypothetical protein
MADPSTIRLAYRAQIRAGGHQVSVESINHDMNDASSANAGSLEDGHQPDLWESLRELEAVRDSLTES